MGSYTITPKGLTAKNYTITFQTGTLTVTPKSITPEVTLSGNMIYIGAQIMPAVAVKDLTEEDFTVTYGENINAGEDAGSVTIQPVENGNYSFTAVTKNFAIEKKSLTITSVTAESRAYKPDDTIVALTGGTLVGVVEADKDNVSFTFNSGTATTAQERRS